MQTSIATITYDLRRMLHQEYGWNLSNIIFGKKEIYIHLLRKM